MKYNLENKFCSEPFTMAQIHTGGVMYLCCPKWLPTPTGTVDKNGLEAAWNSGAAQDMRKAVIDGNFKYCEHEFCPRIQSGELVLRENLFARFKRVIREGKTRVDEFPEHIVVAYDKSCNLSCPSCRAHRIFHGKGTPEYEEARALTATLLKALAEVPPDKAVTLMVSGSGDPFAAPALFELLENFDGESHPNIRFDIHTNGTMFTEEAWNRIKRIHGNINSFYVSVDAATAATHAAIRRGGNWERLMENMRFLYGLRKKELNKAHIVYNMIVQKGNYREMPLFVRQFLGKLADGISFSAMLDWGSWGPGQIYKEQAVWQEDHAEYKELLAVLADPVFDHPQVYMGNLTRQWEAARLTGGYRLKRLVYPAVHRYGRTKVRDLFNPFFMIQKLRELRSWAEFRYAALYLLRLVDLERREYLYDQGEKEFRFIYLLNPFFIAQRLGTLRSPGDLAGRLKAMLRLAKIRLAGNR